MKPKRPLDKPFLMPVEDVFSIGGRGTVATGRIERGDIKTGEEVEIAGLKASQKTTVTGKTLSVYPDITVSALILPCIVL